MLAHIPVSLFQTNNKLICVYQKFFTHVPSVILKTIVLSDKKIYRECLPSITKHIVCNWLKNNDKNKRSLR